MYGLNIQLFGLEKWVGGEEREIMLFKGARST